MKDMKPRFGKMYNDNRLTAVTHAVKRLEFSVIFFIFHTKYLHFFAICIFSAQHKLFKERSKEKCS